VQTNLGSWGFLSPHVGLGSGGAVNLQNSSRCGATSISFESNAELAVSQFFVLGDHLCECERAIFDICICE